MSSSTVAAKNNYSVESATKNSIRIKSFVRKPYPIIIGTLLLFGFMFVGIGIQIFVKNGWSVYGVIWIAAGLFIIIRFFYWFLTRKRLSILTMDQNGIQVDDKLYELKNIRAIGFSAIGGTIFESSNIYVEYGTERIILFDGLDTVSPEQIYNELAPVFKSLKDQLR